jgi:hypothetical protein
MRDVFEMFKIIAYERKRREIDPTLRVIRGCLAEAATESSAVRERLLNLLDFFELADLVARQMERIPTPALVRAARMGDALFRLMGIGGAPGNQETGQGGRAPAPTAAATDHTTRLQEPEPIPAL